MALFAILSAGMYAALALALSLTAMRWIPAVWLPEMRVPPRLTVTAVSAAVFCSFASVTLTAVQISHNFDYPLASAFNDMFYGTKQGTGAFGTLLCGLLWLGASALPWPAVRKAASLVAALGLVFFAATGMHAATLAVTTFMAQAAHLLAVSFWLGFLLVTGWFARPGASWRPFLRWFTPAAATCVGIVTLSGFVLMRDFSTEWIGAWILDYGQVLLIKHLLFIPLLAMAAINGLLLRGNSHRREPRSWIRAEGVIALLIFTTTAVLSRTAPPHDVRWALSYMPPSNLFRTLYDGTITPDLQLKLGINGLSALFFLVALLFLGMIFLSYIRRLPPIVGIVSSLLFAAAGYMGLMTGLQ